MSQRICPTCNGNGWVDEGTEDRAAFLHRLTEQIAGLKGRMADSTETGNPVTAQYVKKADVLALLKTEADQ